MWAEGVLQPSREEDDIYRRLGLPLIPPELREGLGEIEAGQQNRLPRLITPEDIRGCFHVHSYYSDGVNSLEELIAAAKQRGWSYLGLSDHSQSAYYAGGLKAPDLERQRAEVAGPAAGTSRFHPVLGGGIGHPERRLAGLPG